jgi:hypothetical protein
VITQIELINIKQDNHHHVHHTRDIAFLGRTAKSKDSSLFGRRSMICHKRMFFSLQI